MYLWRFSSVHIGGPSANQASSFESKRLTRFKKFRNGHYGVDLRDMHRRAATYVDRILKGEKPAGMPVQLPVKYELVINLKAAKALGLNIPLPLLGRADEVIE